MNAPDDPALANISGQTFRLVRKGYDPKEVRAYLRRVDAAVGGLASAAETAPPTAPQEPSAPVATPLAPVQAAAEITPASVPAPVPDAFASGEVSGSPTDRWDGLGQHVARILAQAETEAATMTESARTRADVLEAEAEADRIAARDELAQSELKARSIVAEAEAEAVAKRAEVEPQVKAHIAATLAGAQSELDETRTALREARARLTDVHALVGRSLGEVGSDPSFGSPDELLRTPAAEPEPGSSSAVE